MTNIKYVRAKLISTLLNFNIENWSALFSDLSFAKGIAIKASLAIIKTHHTINCGRYTVLGVDKPEAMFDANTTKSKLKTTVESKIDKSAVLNTSFLFSKRVLKLKNVVSMP